MASYASGTTVPIDKSKHQIETMLIRHGARKFGYMSGDDHFCIGFIMLNDDGNPVHYAMTIGIPDRNDPGFTRSHGGKRERDQHIAHERWEQECKRVWRSLWLIVKAKIEAVNSGLSTIEREFLADRLMHGGKTLMAVVEEQAPLIEAGAPLLLEHRA